jgi:hypothetical protein
MRTHIHAIAEAISMMPGIIITVAGRVRPEQRK